MRRLRKFIAIGDVHADFALLWAALRAAGCADAAGQPTPPVCSGAYQVVLLGDLIHPKSLPAYEALLRSDAAGDAALGGGPFDTRNAEHLAAAAQVQMRRLEAVRAYQQAAPQSVHIVLGNHDDVALNPAIQLGTGAGLSHLEFDPVHGGISLCPSLAQWMAGFVREVRVGGVQFAHVGPLPAHLHYNDQFYADKSHRRWFLDTPECVEMAGLELGVYGHTPMERGLLVHEGYRFALADTLPRRQFLELMLWPGAVEEGGLTVQGWRVVEF